MRLLAVFILPLLLSAFQVFSQSQKQYERFGDKSYEEGDYYGASIYYKTALKLEDSNLGVMYKYAECLRLYNEYTKAEKYYETIFEKDALSEFPESLFRLAEMQKFNGNYEQAGKHFSKYYKTTRRKSTFFGKKAKHEIKACKFAKRLVLDSSEVIISNAGDLLNTFDSEFSPVFIDDSTIYFSSLRSDKIKKNNEVKDKEYFIKIFKASRNGGSWETTGIIDEVINNPAFHAANGTFSLDKKRFYFSRCTADLKCNLYVSELDGGQWQEPEILTINQEGFTTTQPHITMINKKEVLLFASDRPRGKGKMDIWYSIFTNKNKQFSNPRNLGKKVNSIDNEISPFFDIENKTLYFSSEWHYGLGGFDVFKSKGGFKPQAPENLGPPVNTSVNDFYYTLDSKKEYGFLTSNRKGSFAQKGETCCNDIYLFEFPKEPVEVPVYVSLEELNKYLPVTLYFHNDEPNPKSRDIITEHNYLKTYEEYSAMTATYQEEYSKGMIGEEKVKAEGDIVSFFEDYVDKGAADLELFTELLLKELEKGQEIELTVKGYASPLAKTDYNVNLTLRRISSMLNFMKEHEGGIYIPYLNHTADNGGSLNLVKIPFGEYTADQTVSDNIHDQKNSIYSRKAGLERKIEIVSVQQAHKDSAFAAITFTKEIFDFGAVKPGEELTHVFRFINTGKKDLLITGITPDCECTVASYPKEPVAPGDGGEIEVTFNTSGKSGKQVSAVTLFSNAKHGKKVLSVTAEVISE